MMKREFMKKNQDGNANVQFADMIRNNEGRIKTPKKSQIYRTYLRKIPKNFEKTQIVNDIKATL